MLEPQPVLLVASVHQRASAVLSVHRVCNVVDSPVIRCASNALVRPSPSSSLGVDLERVCGNPDATVDNGNSGVFVVLLRKRLRKPDLGAEVHLQAIRHLERHEVVHSDSNFRKRMRTAGDKPQAVAFSDDAAIEIPNAGRLRLSKVKEPNRPLRLLGYGSDVPHLTRYKRTLVFSQMTSFTRSQHPSRSDKAFCVVDQLMSSNQM